MWKSEDTELRERVAQSCPTLCNSVDLHSPWNSPGQNTGVGCHSLLQGIFPAQGSNPGLPHRKQILYQLSHQGSSRILEWGAITFSDAGQETTIRTGHGTTDWFQIGKGVCPGCLLSSCLFNLYAEYIMRNAGLEEAQAGIKIAGRNINNLRYADDTALMA